MFKKMYNFIIVLPLIGTVKLKMRNFLHPLNEMDWLLRYAERCLGGRCRKWKGELNVVLVGLLIKPL